MGLADEMRVVKLLTEAMRALRKGNYVRALSRLDEAESILMKLERERMDAIYRG